MCEKLSLPLTLLLPIHRLFVQVGHTRNRTSVTKQNRGICCVSCPARYSVLPCCFASASLWRLSVLQHALSPEGSRMATARAFSSSRVASRPTAAPKCVTALPGRRQLVCRAQQVCDLGGGRWWSTRSLIFQPQLLPSSGTPACVRPGSVNLHPAQLLGCKPCCLFTRLRLPQTADHSSRPRQAGSSRRSSPDAVPGVPVSPCHCHRV